ncbi:hypothetical protein WOLCODRAFT_109782 [Wolfiporia cocos MD-104 SS10]|uniref:Velvet domain-containing protein n=1 Tax=Wolfiporia cocos (strain MD-104) TaxID=742152 RepID=A0A2H3JMZ3_WOLCO|nr:hypothetical protein WOLCODRAFT_109782 [Wolfiporia cocos MD-104 SS10]
MPNGTAVSPTCLGRHPLTRGQHALSAGSPQIGGPVAFREGQYEGRTLRAELEELQKANLGRKYARKDRRPLDPPPVVQFRLFEVLDAGTEHEHEREVDCHEDLNGFGAICYVDLYPVPDGDDHPYSPAPSPPPQRPLYAPAPPYAAPLLHAPPRSSPYVDALLPLPPLPYHPYPAPTQNPYAGPYAPYASSYPSPAYSPRSPLPLPCAPAADPDVIAHLDGFAIRESTKCTGALAGATFVQSAALEYKGRNALMFVFSDLAVKLEGSFVLRYRVFNIFSKAQGITDIPVLAERFGGPFKIYSTKEFPGLRASTDLTKHISLYGVRLNLRENERKRRKKSEIEAERRGNVAAVSASTMTSGTDSQGKRRAYGYSDDEDDAYIED